MVAKTKTRSPRGRRSSTSPTSPKLYLPADPLPRFGTPRDLSRQTLGSKAGQVAAQLGTPYMPWQQHVADVALELDPDTGQLWYRVIVLLVPRQSGKTTLILSIAVHRALGWATPQRISYAAQTGVDAREKWADDHVPILDDSPIGKRKPPLYRVRKTNGQEAILWANGSKHGLTAGTEKAGHGPTMDLGFIDEAFAQKDSRLQQAFSPSMITRPDPQLWIVSTAGRSPASSPFLWDNVQSGRERIAAGDSSRVAYFEWSAADDDDRSDPEVWARTIPALGHTVTMDAIRAELDSMPPAEFDRAFLNRWTPQAVESVIPSDRWSHAARSRGMSGRIVLGVDMSTDRKWTTVAAIGDAVGSEGAAGEVVAVDRGSSWVPGRVRELVDRHGVDVVALDATGPVAALIPEFEALGIPLLQVGGTDMGRAFGTFVDAVTAGQFVHRNQAEVNVSVENGVTRRAGDVVRWSRTSSPVDISPVIALTVALWAWRHAPDVPDHVPEPDFIAV